VGRRSGGRSASSSEWTWACSRAPSAREAERGRPKESRQDAMANQGVRQFASALSTRLAPHRRPERRRNRSRLCRRDHFARILGEHARREGEANAPGPLVVRTNPLPRQIKGAFSTEALPPAVLREWLCRSRISSGPSARRSPPSPPAGTRWLRPSASL